MARIVQSTNMAIEGISLKRVGEMVKSRRTFVVRIVTPRDRKSWARFVANHTLTYSVVEVMGRHPVSGKPRAIAVSVQATADVMDAIEQLRIVRDEKQTFTRFANEFQESRIPRMGVGAMPKKQVKSLPLRLSFMTPAEREKYISRSPSRESLTVNGMNMSEFFAMVDAEHLESR